ncbi:MAG: DUF1674 domain-containing protein [Proteobacteria bacterium]|nr:MAG: DUF1674 domain-containing protein [Pseudomonadota bacterium]
MPSAPSSDGQPEGTCATGVSHNSGVGEARDADRRPREIGGRDGPEPTRFGDWEKAGRCIDF